MTPDAVPLATPLATPLGGALPAGRFHRLRLALLVLLAVAWVSPWLGSERGPDRTGALGALALLAAWGIAATALLAKTRRGLAIGEAATSCAVATLMTVLVVDGHAWIPGPDPRAAWVPIFGPLAALSALDMGVRIFRPAAGNEVTVIRAGAAIVAGLSLIVALEGVAAGAALWIGLAPVAVLWPKTPRGAAVGREALALVAALGLVLARRLPAAGVSGEGDALEVPTLFAHAYFVLAALLVLLAARGVVSPAPAASAPAAPSAP